MYDDADHPALNGPHLTFPHRERTGECQDAIAWMRFEPHHPHPPRPTHAGVARPRTVEIGPDSQYADHVLGTLAVAAGSSSQNNDVLKGWLRLRPVLEGLVDSCADQEDGESLGEPAAIEAIAARDHISYWAHLQPR